MRLWSAAWEPGQARAHLLDGPQLLLNAPQLLLRHGTVLFSCFCTRRLPEAFHGRLLMQAVHSRRSWQLQARKQGISATGISRLPELSHLGCCAGPLGVAVLLHRRRCRLRTPPLPLLPRLLARLRCRAPLLLVPLPRAALRRRLRASARTHQARTPDLCFTQGGARPRPAKRCKPGLCCARSLDCTRSSLEIPRPSSGRPS